jgi:hypothetical protein
MIMKKLPTICPSCESALEVKRLCCHHCETEVEGSYSLPPITLLPVEDQQFMVQFTKASGSLKTMAKLLGVSYPTVRNRLDEVISRLEQMESAQRGHDHAN